MSGDVSLDAESSQVTTDHGTIKRWAEERDGDPARIEDTEDEGDAEQGVLRIAFMDHDEFEPITWDEWFETFEEQDLALVYQEETAEGDPSEFYKLVDREDV